MKYVVTYLIIKMVLIPCPRIEPQPDEFGRVPQSVIQTAQICSKADTTNKSKWFFSRKEAVEFIQRGKDKKAAGWDPMGELSNFELSVLK